MEKIAAQSDQVSVETLTQVQALPQLPSIIRYLDDFADEWRVVRNIEADEWEINANGIKDSLNFSSLPHPYRLLAKHWAAWTMARLSISLSLIHI